MDQSDKTGAVTRRPADLPGATTLHQQFAGQKRAGLSASPKKERLARLPEVLSRCGIGKSLCYALMAKGEFPASVRIGGRSIAWRESDIDAWIAARIEGVTQ